MLFGVLNKFQRLNLSLSFTQEPANTVWYLDLFFMVTGTAGERS